MTDINQINTSGLMGDRWDRFFSFIQTLINFVFITSWIAISIIVALSAVFIVVLFFIT
jgi:hypothetical protein